MRNILVYSFIMITICTLQPVQKAINKTTLNDSIKPDTVHGKTMNWNHQSKPKTVKKKLSMPELFQYRKFLLY